jgi:hypothetical protein
VVEGLVDVEGDAEEAESQVGDGQVKDEEVVGGAHVLVEEDCPDNQEVSKDAFLGKRAVKLEYSAKITCKLKALSKEIKPTRAVENPRKMLLLSVKAIQLDKV